MLASLPRNQRLEAGERRNGWVNVRSGRVVGWVSQQYVSSNKAPAPIIPPRSGPKQSVQQPALASGGSCPSRRYCTQFGSCQ